MPRNKWLLVICRINSALNLQSYCAIQGTAVTECTTRLYVYVFYILLFCSFVGYYLSSVMSVGNIFTEIQADV